MSDTAMCWEAEAELAWKSSSSSAISAISSPEREKSKIPALSMMRCSVTDSSLDRPSDALAMNWLSECELRSVPLPVGRRDESGGPCGRSSR